MAQQGIIIGIVTQVRSYLNPREWRCEGHNMLGPNQGEVTSRQLPKFPDIPHSPPQAPYYCPRAGLFIATLPSLSVSQTSL